VPAETVGRWLWLLRERSPLPPLLLRRGGGGEEEEEEEEEEEDDDEEEEVGARPLTMA
jgi:hypothetical protein